MIAQKKYGGGAPGLHLHLWALYLTCWDIHFLWLFSTLSPQCRYILPSSNFLSPFLLNHKLSFIVTTMVQAHIFIISPTPILS